jgi:hypothetical protein
MKRKMTLSIVFIVIGLIAFGLIDTVCAGDDQQTKAPRGSVIHPHE